MKDLQRNSVAQLSIVRQEDRRHATAANLSLDGILCAKRGTNLIEQFRRFHQGVPPLRDVDGVVRLRGHEKATIWRRVHRKVTQVSRPNRRVRRF